MGEVIKFRMHAIDEVHADIPKAVQPSKSEFNKLVEKHGLYRELGGKRFMLDRDVEQLFEIIRAKPTEADMRGGPARLVYAERSPHELGYLVVIGDAIDKDGAIYIGYAPRDGKGVSDLRTLIQMGYPGKIAVMEFCAATPHEVEEVRAKLKKSNVGSEGWFVRNDDVTNLLLELRATDDIEDDEEDETEAETKMGA